MPHRRDTEQVDAVGRESSLTRGGRVAFGGLLEAVKATAGGGTKNARGDFTVEELRAVPPETAGAVIDRCIERDATVLDLERRVRRLRGDTVRAIRRSVDGTLTLHVEDAALQLPPTAWLLRVEGEELARGADEPAWTLGQLRALEGRTVTRADFRRRDHAIALELADDPFAAGYELLVRGRGRRQTQPWALTSADGTRVGPGGLHRG